MAVIRTAEEVYNHYIDRFGYDPDGDPDAIALFTYALVEKDKYDWIAHHRAQHAGEYPDDAEMEQWYASKPENYFEEKYQRALTWYRAFARSLLREEIDQQKLAAVSEYVGNRLNLIPQLGISLVSNFIFVLLIGAIAVYVFADFSPIAWVKAHILSSTRSGN